MNSFELLETKRRHVRTYRNDLIPPKEQIDDALWKAWKCTPSKNNCMPYSVFVYGPEQQEMKDITHRMCHQNHIKAELRAVEEGKQKITQQGKLNPDYEHIRNNAYLFTIHSRVVKEMNPYYQREEEKGHFADQKFPDRVNRIVDSVAVEVGMFIQNLTNYLLEYDIDVSYTSCFYRDPAEWQLAGMDHIKWRPIVLMSAGYGSIYRRDVLKRKGRDHEDYKPDITDVIEWI